MDNLEKWITEHRDKWDSHSAPANTWESIIQQMDKDLKRKRYMRWGVVLIIASLLIGMVYRHVSHTQAATLNAEDPLLFAQMEEYNQSVHYFESQSEMYKNELITLGVERTVLADIEQLDLMEVKLMKELKNTQGAYRQIILQALIENHMMQVSLLQELITELNQVKQDEKLYQNL